jgi:hypothetical protein
MDERSKQIRFKTEKSKRPYQPVEGSWESLLAGVRDMLPEQVHNTGEGAYFIDQDPELAKKMTLREAVFQYFLAGKGHIILATKIIDSFEPMRSGAASVGAKNDIINELAGRLYDNYPDKYKASVKR